MSELPIGTVTFLFTDIEGSTTRWEHQTHVMQTALVRHDDILRLAIVQHGGIVFKTVGDAFYAVFARAPDALQAALAAQRALHAETWDASIGAVRVRMALHTGTPEVRGDDYFGPPLNRVARLVSAGHGGQVLLSAATQELARDLLPHGVGLRDLGEHRLKDLIRPERIFQVVSDLPSDFAALRTLDNRPNNLPLQRDPLIGREREVAEIITLVRKSDVGLVTLTGPGGTGKTRLSLQVAADMLYEFADGVWFVDLSAFSDPMLVATTIIQVLGVPEGGGQPLLSRLQAYVREKYLLLVLDNFEQILPAAPLVAGLLRVAQNLKVLVTSRESLHLRGEQEYPVPPLPLPSLQRRPEVTGLSQYAAVALFVARAQAVRPDFQVTNENAPAVAEICVRLDGLPLAIELAAARVKLLPPEALLQRLDNRLKLLTGGARDLPARQQTIRNAIDWSYDLLMPAEQTFFARLGVFVGGWTLQAAEAVCNGADDLDIDVLDGVQSLLDKSLVQTRDGITGEPRFTMLETIREFALEALHKHGETEMLHHAHAIFFLSLVEHAEPELQGKQQALWLDRLEADYDQLRSAFEWTGAATAVPILAWRFAAALWRFWEMRGYFSEGRRCIELLLTTYSLSLNAGHAIPSGSSTSLPTRLTPSLVPPVIGAKVLDGAGRLARNQSDYARARAFHDESLRLSRECGDDAGQARALANLGVVAHDLGEYTQAQACHEESLRLWQQIGDQLGMARALTNLGVLAHDQGDSTRALQYFEAGLVVMRELDNGAGIAMTLNNLGMAMLKQGNYEQARPRLEESLRLYSTLQEHYGIASSLSSLGQLALAVSDFPQAHMLYTASLAEFKALEDRAGIAECLEGLARTAAEGPRYSDHLQRAARLWGAAAALRSVIGVPLSLAEQAALDRQMKRTRAIDESTFVSAWVEGQSMALDRIVAYTLDPSMSAPA